MPDLGDKPLDGGVSPNTEEANNANPQTDYQKAHKEAQDELSKVAEALINANLLLAEKDPKTILSMDKKMQNKVIKKLYGYENIEELQLIQGNDFFNKKDDGDEEEDKMSILEKEVKILKMQREKGELEMALENFRLINPQLFTVDSEAMDKIKTELEDISTKLPHKERVEKAARLVFGNYKKMEADGYKALQDNKNPSPTSKKEDENQTQTEIAGVFNNAIAAYKAKQERMKKFRF